MTMKTFTYKEFATSLPKVANQHKKYFFYGENNFCMNIVANKLTEYISAEKEVIYGWDENLEQFFQKMLIPTLFAKKSVVVLRNIEFAKNKFQKFVKEFFERYSPEQYIIIMYESEIPFYEQQKNEFVKFLLSNFVSVSFQNFNRYQLVNEFIPQHCNKKLTKEAKELLCDSIGDDLWLLYNELQKISLLETQKKEITEEEIEKFCNVYENGDIKNLLNSIVSVPDVRQSLSILKNLFLQGVQPVYISVTLFRYFRKQFLYNKIPRSKVLEILRELHFLDYKIKTTDQSNYAVEMAVLNLCKLMKN